MKSETKTNNGAGNCSSLASCYGVPWNETLEGMIHALSAIAVERAIGKDWDNHPMFGIGCDIDERAREWQEQKSRILKKFGHNTKDMPSNEV